MHTCACVRAGGRASGRACVRVRVCVYAFIFPITVFLLLLCQSGLYALVHPHLITHTHTHTHTSASFQSQSIMRTDRPYIFPGRAGHIPASIGEGVPWFFFPSSAQKNGFSDTWPHTRYAEANKHMHTDTDRLTGIHTFHYPPSYAYTHIYHKHAHIRPMSHRSVRLENNMSQALVCPSSEPSAQSQKSSLNFEESNETFTGGWNPNALHSCLGLPLADAQKLVSVICVLSVHVYAHRCSILMVHACLCWDCVCVFQWPCLCV